MRTAHFHHAFVKCSTLNRSVTPVLCLIMEFRIVFLVWHLAFVWELLGSDRIQKLLQGWCTHACQPLFHGFLLSGRQIRVQVMLISLLRTRQQEWFPLVTAMATMIPLLLLLRFLPLLIPVPRQPLMLSLQPPSLPPPSSPPYWSCSSSSSKQWYHYYHWILCCGFCLRCCCYCYYYCCCY